MISLTRKEIESLIDLPKTVQALESAYRASSQGNINLPPVGHIAFAEGADCHIKYGHIKGDKVFVIKIATGFPQNSISGLPSGNGLVLVLSAETGQVEAMLHDEMVLTDIRTGLGGAIASRSLACQGSQNVLVAGTGQQARRQIEAHNAILPGSLIFKVWGRDATKAKAVVNELATGIVATQVDDLETAIRSSDIVITATGATAPIIKSDWVQPGTHITAVGADAPGKQELEIKLISRADIVAVDLVSQCADHGEISHASRAGEINTSDLIELGALLGNSKLGRANADQITIADLTGIAAQDIAIAKAVLETLQGQTHSNG